MYGHKPNTVEAHFFDIVELCRYTVQVAYTVVVCVVKAVNEYLVPIAILVVYDVECYLIVVLLILFTRGKGQNDWCKQR